MLSLQRLHTTPWTSTWLRGIVLVCAVGALVTACSTGGAFQRGGQAALRGDWDMAVSEYTTAVQSEPNRVDYRMTLDRAKIAASQIHFDKARDMERRDQLDVALMEYRKVVEYYPANQEARAKIAALEQTIRARVEASRPRPAIDLMREQARKAPAEPMLNPKSRELNDFKFGGQVRDILIGMGAVAGINVTFDQPFPDKAYNVDLKNISFEQALQQVMAANQLFYKVIGDTSIVIIPDNQTKRQVYEEQAVQTFFLSHVDPTKLLALINTIIRPTQAIQPVTAASAESNTIVVRASVPMLQIIGRIIEANDRPRAEIVIDVEILEINRQRAKQYGLELSQYQIGLGFSPEAAPGGAGAAAGAGSFNLNTVSKGVSTNDFYATVPSALIRFLETDVNTKIIAKPQLRGTEGAPLSLNLGEEIPVPSTTFSSFSAGGLNTVPMTSFQYRPTGVNLEVTPRVTYDGDVIMELKLEVSAQGPDVNIAGQNLPSFTSRKVGTKLRLRDGESNLLAGLLNEKERTSLKGVPGTLHIPILSKLFASNDTQVTQTDIVMLLTPHVVRTHELTAQNFMPIYIGSQQNLGLTGPPPAIGQTTEPETVPPAAAPPTPQAGGLAPGTTVPGPPGSSVKAVIPPGSSPIPGTVGVPAQPAAAPPAQAAPPPATPPAQPPQVVAPPAPPPQPAPAAAKPPAQAAPPPATPPVQPPQVVAPPVLPAAPPAQAKVMPPPTAPPEPAAAVPPAAAAPPAQAMPAPPAPAAKAEVQNQVLVGAPTTPLMVAGGPYTVPIAISGASRLSTVSLSVTFNPRVLRVRLPQEGDFMRKGGAKVTFTHKIDEASGRIDLTVTRAADTVGASGDGVVVGIIFDAIGAGTSTLTVAGVAFSPGGTAVPLQFVPATVTVR